MNKKCYGCYQTLKEGTYHPKCSIRLFGTSIPPQLDSTLSEIESMAKATLKQRQAITGVQRKLSLQIENSAPKRLTVVGALGGSYILKPQTPEFQQMPEIEDLCMHLANICGIKTALHGLLPMKDGSIGYLTKRFDRDHGKKIHVEDLCQLSDLLTEQKYRSSYERTGKIIARYSSVPGDDLLRFFELLIFSFLIGNNDMHLKNFSMFTEDAENIALTPAYDLLAVRMFLSKKDDPEDVALSLNGKKSKLTQKDFFALANHFGIPAKVSTRIIKQQLEAVPAMKALVAKSYLSPPAQKELVKIIENQATMI